MAEARSLAAEAEALEEGRPTTGRQPLGLRRILWILRTGARWRDLLGEYVVGPATCWRRLYGWEEDDVSEDIWQEYLRRLDDLNLLGGQECFLDATFMPAKRGPRGRPHA